jgi:hypothetical protein
VQLSPPSPTLTHRVCSRRCRILRLKICPVAALSSLSSASVFFWASFRHHRHSAADFRHQRHFGVICCHLLSSAVICCHVTAAREYEYSCSALTRARVLLLPRMPQGRAEGVAGLDLGLQVPLRSAASTANIAECRRGSCGCSLGRSRFFQNLLTAWPGFVSSSPQRTARVTGAR